MNDFTKEELQALLLWGYDRVEAIGKDEFIAEGHDEIFKKLQGLLVNSHVYNEGIERINSMNNKLLLVLGYATSIVLEMRSLLKDKEDPRIAWVTQAIDNIVYQDKPLPPMPEL